MAADNAEVEATGRKPAGEAPRGATTFTVPLVELGCAGEEVPRRVAADVERGRNGYLERLTVRTPTTTYVFEVGTDSVRQEPLPGEPWKIAREVDAVPEWLDAVLRYLGLEEAFR